MNIQAGRDKIILVDVKVLEAQEGGFDVQNEKERHDFGVIYSVPTKEDYYKEGESIVLRDRANPETLTFEGVKYTFVQPLDILCKINNHE